MVGLVIALHSTTMSSGSQNSSPTPSQDDDTSSQVARMSPYCLDNGCSTSVTLRTPDIVLDSEPSFSLSASR